MTRYMTRCCAAVLLGVMSTALLATAQASEPAAGTAPETSTIDRFAKGEWALQLAGSYINSEGVSTDNTLGGTGGVSLGYYFLDGCALFGELTGYSFDQDWYGQDLDAWGGGIDLLLRWHFLRGDDWSIYADGGGGIIELNEDFIAGGSRFNFTARVGFGASLKLSEKIDLVGGVRWFHMSNARIYGVDENPGLNAVEYYAGLVLWF